MWGHLCQLTFSFLAENDLVIQLRSTIILQTILTCLYGAVCDLLSEVNMDDEVSGGLESMFAGDGPYGRLFSGLETNHLQMKYYKEHFQLVVSEALQHNVYA